MPDLRVYTVLPLWTSQEKALILTFLATISCQRKNFPLSDPRIRTMRRESRDKRSWDKNDGAGGKASGKVRLKVGAQPGVF